MILYFLIAFVSIAPFLPATENPHWFFRTADFVRPQSLVLQLLLLVLFLYFEEIFTLFSWILLGALVFSIFYQLAKVGPYSSWFPSKKNPSTSEGKIRIFAGNVFQDNKDHQKFLTEIKRFDPEIVLTMETNKEWEDALSVLEKDYPFTVKIPQENYYGMHLYSKMELQDVSVNYLIEKNVPSIYFNYPLKNGTPIFFACLHPAPPSPTENDTSEERDAELMVIGKHIRNLKTPAVVCGDMNDVVWSRTTRLFRKLTGMTDPRLGRGFYSTYNAKYFFMRFPIDHLFHTKDLYVGKMERSNFFGSDHFAMYYEIHYNLNMPQPAKPKLNGDEKKEVEEIIENGDK